MKLRIGHLSTVYHTALIMRGLHMLEQHHISASWKLFGGGPAIVEALRQEELDIGYIGLPPAMIGISQGAEIKCVAGGHVEGTALCTTKHVSKQSAAGVIKSLEGERIGSPPKGSIHDILLRHLLKQQGVEAEVVNYPWADFIPLAMEDGGITAAIGTPALAVFLKRELDAQIALSPAKIWPFNPSYGIIAREDFLDEKSLKVFVGVHEDASNLIINAPRKAAETAAKVLGFVDNAFALEAIKLSPRYCAALPPEYIKTTMDFVPVMLELGYLSKPLSKKDIFNTDIIEEIHPETSHYTEPINL
ncbi:MAG: ABC transporter substrate-binding protein [Candidatus Hydrothermarchaeales archaeon]